MLVLSRKKGQAVLISRDIRVTVLEVSGNRVKLGFSGPSGVPIYREELRVESPAEPPPPSKPPCPACASTRD